VVANGLLLALPLLAFLRGWKEPAARRRFVVLSVTAWAALGVVIVSGGDCYLGARFLVPPFLVTLIATGLAAAQLEGRVAWGLQLALVACGAIGMRSAFDQTGTKLAALGGGGLTEAHFACSADIAQRLVDVEPSVRLAQHDFQRFKYFQDSVEVFDMSGINAPEVAHRPSREPVRFGKEGIDLALAAGYELVHVDFRWTSAFALANHSLREVLEDPVLVSQFFGLRYEDAVMERLERDYLPVSMPNACGTDWFNFFVRRDLAQLFADAGFVVGPG